MQWRNVSNREPMATDKAYLKTKLAQLEEYVAEVRELRGEPKTAFAKASRLEAAAERRLEKAIQCAIDIASYIVSRNALGNPTHYRDLFLFLGRAEILPPLLVERLEKMAGFRNILIHEYEEVDENRVYQAVHQDIDDLVAFAKTVYEKLIAGTGQPKQESTDR